jgi:hypothetical protein
MGEIIYLSQRRIRITLYTRGLGGRPRHPDDERALAIINGVVKELGPCYFEVQTKARLAHVLDAIVHGGWLAPVVMVESTVLSQRTVPDRGALRAYLAQQITILRPRLAKSG